MTIDTIKISNKSRLFDQHIFDVNLDDQYGYFGMFSVFRLSQWETDLKHESNPRDVLDQSKCRLISATFRLSFNWTLRDAIRFIDKDAALI